MVDDCSRGKQAKPPVLLQPNRHPCRQGLTHTAQGSLACEIFANASASLPLHVVAPLIHSTRQTLFPLPVPELTNGPPKNTLPWQEGCGAVDLAQVSHQYNAQVHCCTERSIESHRRKLVSEPLPPVLLPVYGSFVQ
jgi:hypothetical protein